MSENMESINERINPHGWSPHDPVLRWIPGRAAETLMLESKHDQPNDGYTGECDYNDPHGVWGDDGTDNMLDAPMSDNEWVRLLECVGIV